jgi:hypothetical protein
MPSTCPKCGAQLPTGETCRERFDLFLAKEFENPGTYGAVHHLTVASYMLQHNGYSREAWPKVREMLRQFIEDGLTPAEARRQNRQQVDSGKRTWKVTGGEKLPEVDQIDWTRTVADVRLDTVEHYQEDITAWATSVLSDTEELVQSLTHS